MMDDKLFKFKNVGAIAGVFKYPIHNNKYQKNIIIFKYFLKYWLFDIGYLKGFAGY
jgi:hypothetical protein